VINLPWPHRDLSSNARVHPLQLHRRKKAAKVVAGWAAMAAPRPCFPDAGDVRLVVTFEPPSRRIDRQNMPHLVKAYIDGLAEAWGINDNRFIPEYVYGEPVRDGRVTFALPDIATA